MKLTRLAPLAALAILGCAGESNAPTSASSGGTGAGGAASACPPCVSDATCSGGALCAQIAGDTYCAPDCSNGKACSADRACTPVAGADGKQLQVCVPRTDVCGGPPQTSGSGSSSAASGGPSEVCGALHGPDVKACCTSCAQGAPGCQLNGCYGGWWCNVDTCKCQVAPAPCDGSSSAGSSGSGSSGSGGSETGSVTGISGGKLDTLSFAIVGDTRPPVIDDTAGYPKKVIQTVWQDVEAASPRPAFAVTTGDYVFAKPFGAQAAPQIDLYLAARQAFSGVMFPALGNHECTGATASNCGAGSADGVTANYTAFLDKMLAPIAVTTPYYTVNIGSTTSAWTAKLVFIAANAWSAKQATWLAAELAKPTTYTFVVRHESASANTAPGVTPSQAIIAQHPYTLLIVGHTHTYAHYASEKQLIVGNGGAPLTGGVNYGYVIARQRADGAMVFQEHDYTTNQVNDTFAVKPDGTSTP